MTAPAPQMDTFEVVNELGLHARAAAKLVRLSESFRCSVELRREDDAREEWVNAKSVMGVLLLCGVRGTRVIVRTQGSDATTALDAIRTLFAERFGEGR